MRTRTRLTTPPGQEPEAGHSSSQESERYSPALALPVEPSVPGRRRKLALALAAVLVLAIVGFGVFQLVTAGQTFDPALNRDGGTQEP